MAKRKRSESEMVLEKEPEKQRPKGHEFKYSECRITPHQPTQQSWGGEGAKIAPVSSGLQLSELDSLAERAVETVMRHKMQSKVG